GRARALQRDVDAPGLRIDDLVLHDRPRPAALRDRHRSRARNPRRDNVYLAQGYCREVARHGVRRVTAAWSTPWTATPPSVEPCTSSRLSSFRTTCSRRTSG